MRVLIILCLALCGCATAPENREAYDYRRQVDLANWQACDSLYVANSKATIHRQHSHNSTNGRDSNRYVRDDLRANNCHRILASRGLWNEY